MNALTVHPLPVVLTLALWAMQIWFGYRDRNWTGRIADGLTITVILWLAWAWLGKFL
jgi:hypothetical protein